MYPDDDLYDEADYDDPYEPTEADLYDIENEEDHFWFENYMSEFEDYEPYDWSDVISEHDYEDSE